MPMYDRECTVCGARTIDVLEPIVAPDVPCPCGGETVRVWLSHASSVVQDSIEGGIEIKHGLCNEDGTPRRYYSKSEIQREAARRGKTNYVVHVPERGSDKSKFTTRWV